jgi:hypothetical protein
VGASSGVGREVGDLAVKPDPLIPGKRRPFGQSLPMVGSAFAQEVHDHLDRVAGVVAQDR